MAVKFSHKPYIPFGAEPYDIHIVRLSPHTDKITLEWLGSEPFYTVEVKEGDQIVKTVKTAKKTVTVDGLNEGVLYSLTVYGESKEKKSRERIFITGDYLGDCINYLHPDDLQYEFSGRFIASPHIVEFKDAFYVSMDVFRSGNQIGGYVLTLIYRSKDLGKTWEYVTDLVPSEWGRLFVVNGKLCILTCAYELGSLIVSSSSDGETWSKPTVLMYGNGGGYPVGVHMSPTTNVLLDGKMYFAFEYGGYPVKRFDSLMGCYDTSKDVLDESAWTFTEPKMVEFEWGGDKDIRFAIEGNAVERDGEIYDLARFTAGKALMLKYNKEKPEKAMEFYKAVDLPVGHCKFFIQRDTDGTYYAMGNHSCYPRQIIELYKSKDLENWEKVKTLIDISHLSAEKDGIQYPSFLIKDRKLYTVLRTGLHGADTFHNTNAITFRVFDID